MLFIQKLLQNSNAFYTNAFTEFVCFKRNSTNDDKLQASFSKFFALNCCSLDFSNVVIKASVP